MCLWHMGVESIDQNPQLFQRLLPPSVTVRPLSMIVAHSNIVVIAKSSPYTCSQMSAIPALRENTTKSQKRAATKLSTEPPLKKSRITPPTESNKSTLSGQTQLDETDDALGRVVNLLGFDDIVTKARNTLDNLIERCEDGTSRRVCMPAKLATNLKSLIFVKYELANLQYTLNRIHSNLASIPADLPNVSNIKHFKVNILAYTGHKAHR